MNLGVWAAAVVTLLGILVLVHELGHFVMARLFGVRVLRFSLGFGPRLFGFRGHDTDYRVSLFPLGGYVRLLGELPGEAIAPSDRHHALCERPLWQRYAIVAAGPLANLVLPLVIFVVFYAGQGQALPSVLGTVLPGQPAARAGLLPGDRVESIDGAPVRTWEELDRDISAGLGRTLRVGILRDDVREERDVTPESVVRPGPLGFPERGGWIGVSPRFARPQIGVIDPESPAARAGLQSFDFITSVNGTAVTTFAELAEAIRRSGAAPLRITALRGGTSLLPFSHVEIQDPVSALLVPSAVFDATGRRSYDTGILPADMFVYAVEPGSPADRMGVRRGDRITALDGQDLLHWDILRQRLAAAPDHTFKLAWVSPGNLTREASFKQDVRSELDAYRQSEERFVFGAINRFAFRTEPLEPVQSRVVYAVGHACERTVQMVGAMVVGFLDLVRGEVPLSALGGPIMIGYVAGVAAEQGLDQYLWLVAILSINLALLNFLPIPILDGGALLFFTLELVRRRPPSPRTRAVASWIGLALVATLTALALRNDVVRYLLR